MNFALPVMAEKLNFHIVLQSRPGEDNEPTEDNFCFQQIPFPSELLEDGQVLIKNEYLSVDPALRCRMNADSGTAYIKAWPIGETLQGFGGVGTIVSSRDPHFVAGDLVTSHLQWPWKVYFILPSSSVRKIPEEISRISATLSLSLAGLTGLTAYLGILEGAHVTRGANQTMVVSGAAGSTGSFAGQIAKAEGCAQVVGICGTDEKCACLTGELEFDAAINYRTESVTGRLENLCPGGVDIYFDNVGGSISDEVIRLMKPDSHVVLCGQIAVYNKNLPYPPPMSDEISSILQARNITRERFIVVNHQAQFESSVEKLMGLYTAGLIKVKETVEKGLANTGRAFISMMKGGNLGKQLVKVTEE